jgi:Methyltransferase domain
MTWREWFEKSLAKYPTPWKYLFEAQEYMKPVMQAAKRWCPPPATVLEAGCGIGMTAMAFAAEGYTVHGVDFDSDVLSLASKLPWYSSLNLNHIDVTRMRGWYDLSFSGGVIEHMTSETSLAMLRTLKDSAPVQIVVIPSPLQLALAPDQAEMGEQPIPMADLIQLCCHAGWTVVEAFGFGDPGPKVVNIGDYEPWMSMCVVGRNANAA